MKILCLCCVEFYKKVKELCGVEPFFDALLITIAALSMRKSLFVKNGKIGIIPKSSYGNNHNQSVLGLMWLSEIGKRIPNFRWKL